jgi:hypothetical protein
MTHNHGLQNTSNKPFGIKREDASYRNEWIPHKGQRFDPGSQNVTPQGSIHQTIANEIHSIHRRFCNLMRLYEHYRVINNPLPDGAAPLKHDRAVQSEIIGGDLDAMCSTLDSYRNQITSLLEKMASMDRSHRDSLQSSTQYRESVSSALWIKWKHEERRAVELAQLRNQLSLLSESHKSQEIKLREQDVLIRYYITELRELELISGKN